MTDQPKIKSASFAGVVPRKVLGITERERPITVGWCGNDNCEHLNHKQMRAAQAAADTRANKK